MRLCLILTCLAFIHLLGCNSRGESRSQLFNDVFLDDSTTFRGSMLGEKIQTVLEHEKNWVPSHQDKLGLTYQIELENEGSAMIIDYYSDNLKTDKESNRLTSIVAKVLLPDEVEAAKLYNEVQSYFNNRYGLSSGKYGAFEWESSNSFTSSIEVRLKLNEDKKGISLNFIDTESRLKPEPLMETS
ncbi:MAG: hypothetical protein AAF587_33330 [Bacteroidota bacterium]